MSKTRRSAGRSRSASRPKPPVRRASPKRKTAKRKPKARGGAIELKPIREQIVRAVEGLRTFPPTEAIKLTIERLERCLVEFDAICNPQSPDGCGPNMDFPWP